MCIEVDGASIFYDGIKVATLVKGLSAITRGKFLEQICVDIDVDSYQLALTENEQLRDENAALYSDLEDLRGQLG